MSIKAINTSATKKYVSELDEAVDSNGNPLPEATVWHLSAMDSYIEAHATSKATSYAVKEGINVSDLTKEDNMADKMEYSLDAQSLFLEVCRFCIKGWDNFEGADGKPIEFKTISTNLKGRMYQVVHPDLMAQIPLNIIQELYVEIDNMSKLSKEEIKNLEKG